jgi:hypothetical protein
VRKNRKADDVPVLAWLLWEMFRDDDDGARDTGTGDDGASAKGAPPPPRSRPSSKS